MTLTSLLCPLIAALLSATAPTNPARTPTTIPTQYAPAVRALAGEFQSTLSRVRYMQSDRVKDATIRGWEGFPTRRYTYNVKDKDGTVKSADVVMLNPSADQIAQWIVFALLEVKGSYDPADARKIFKHIIAQSGGQFPVAGVVYEDILPADGKYETYCFRDGVTVEIDAVPHRSTDPLTPAQIEASINGNVKRVFTYARIQSTTPQQYIAAGGDPNVLRDAKPTQHWLDAVRSSYQAACSSPRNELLIAWVKANVH